MYHAIHKDSGRLTILMPEQINDKFEDTEGHILICSTEQEIFWLIADSGLIDAV